MTASLPSPGGSSNIWATLLNAFLVVSHNTDGTLNGTSGIACINVTSPRYGADPTGVADSTTAIQAAINAATGSLAPASFTRTCTASVYLPAGFYKVSSDLIIRSVEGFRLIGDGPGNTTILASGTGFTQAVLLIDGSADGVYEGFAIQGSGSEGSGASGIPDGIRLDWTTAAARSTTGNKFADIRIRALKAVTLFSLECNGSRQCDGTVMDNVVVTGGQTPGSWSNTGNWQVGFAIGDGTYGNNYDHVQNGTSASDCYYGWKINASSVKLDGAQPAGNFSDFWVLTNGQTSIRNVQSQNSGQFITSPASFSPGPTSVEDVLFTTLLPNSGYPIAQVNGGIWAFKNIAATTIYAAAAYQTGVITVAGEGSTRPAFASFDNIAIFGARAASFSITNANVTMRGYINYNPNTGTFTAPVAGDMLSCYTGSAWTNVV